MSKGKYAAKASNRAAAIDNEVIADLRHRLADADAENTRLNVELDATRRRITGEVNRRVDAAMRDERKAVVAERDEAAVQFAAFKIEAADALMAMLREWYDGLVSTLGTDQVFPADLFSVYGGDSDLLRILELLDNDNAGARLHQFFKDCGWTGSWER